MTQDQMFDVESWKNQGMAALSSLEGRKNDLLAAVEQVTRDIEGIKTSLGMDLKEIVHRVRVKPVIQRHLSDKKAITFDELKKLVQTEMPTCDDEKFLAGLLRTAKDSEGTIKYNAEQGTIKVVAKKVEVAATA